MKAVYLLPLLLAGCGEVPTPPPAPSIKIVTERICVPMRQYTDAEQLRIAEELTQIAATEPELAAAFADYFDMRQANREACANKEQQ